MKPVTIVGLVLVLVGILLVGWQGVAFFTTNEPVAQFGPLQLWGPVQHAVWLGPVVGGVVIVVGVAMMLMGAGRRAS
jgi:hypothetical protein